MKKVSRQSRPPRRLRHAFLALLVFCAAGGMAAAAEEVAWQPSYEKALAEAQSQQKLLLLDFTAEWCGWCKKMESEVYSTPEVSAALRDVVCVKVDIDENAAIALAYQVQSIPRTIILNASKQIVTDRLGFSAAADFLDLLKEAKNAKPEELGGQVAPEIEADSEEPELGVPETLDSPQSTAQVMALLASQEPYSRSQAEEAVAKSMPQMLPELVKGLSSGVLAERIAAITALRANGHDVAPFDPWASRAEREKAVEPWNAWLAQQPVAAPVAEALPAEAPPVESLPVEAPPTP